jgi:hypothetical protein
VRIVDMSFSNAWAENARSLSRAQEGQGGYRVSTLVGRGLLVDAITDWLPREDDWNSAVSFWRTQNSAPLIDITGGHSLSADVIIASASLLMPNGARWINRLRRVSLPLHTQCNV